MTSKSVLAQLLAEAPALRWAHKNWPPGPRTVTTVVCCLAQLLVTLRLQDPKPGAATRFHCRSVVLKLAPSGTTVLLSAGKLHDDPFRSAQTVLLPNVEVGPLMIGPSRLTVPGWLPVRLSVPVEVL